MKEEVKEEVRETSESTQEVERDWKDMYIRLYADFDNFKKRIIKEKEELKRNTKMESLSSVLELDNDLHLAIKVIKDKKSLQNIKIITDKLKTFLEKNGVEEMQTDTYDPDMHEVISVLNTGTESIVDVVSKGYKINGVVFKYPKVIISK